MSDDITDRLLADPRMWQAAAEFGRRLRRKPGAPDPFKETREAIARMLPVIERKPSDANAREVGADVRIELGPKPLSEEEGS